MPNAARRKPTTDWATTLVEHETMYARVPIIFIGLRIIGARPWWLYDMADFPSRTREQIEAGLTAPAGGPAGADAEAQHSPSDARHG